MNENHSEHLIGYSAKAKTHYTSFPVASPQQVGAGKSLLYLTLLCRVIFQSSLQ